MQVGEQVIDLFVIEHVAKAFHFVAAHADDILDTIVVGRHPAGRQVVPFEQTPQTWPLALPRRIRRVAAIAILVVDMPPRGLARRQAELGITFATLNFASARQREQKDNYASDPGTLQTLDIQKRKLQRKNLNHSTNVCRGDLLTSYQDLFRNSQYWHGFCGIFTIKFELNGDEQVINFLKNPRENSV
jgi:hypothetical protein